MDRREFGRTAAALALTGAPTWALAQRLPVEGKEYRVLDTRASTEAPAGKIEVVEFFWYSCPHCNRFESTFVSWIQRQQPDVHVRRVPVAFRPNFVPQQRLFYTLEAMNRLDLHPKVFEAIHRNSEPTASDEQIIAWAEKNGLDRAKFQELFGSFAVVAKARRAAQLQDAYKIDGVPSLGVAGRFFTDGPLAGNMERALQVVDYLVAEIRKGK